MSTAINKQQLYDALEHLSPEQLAEVVRLVEHLQAEQQRGAKPPSGDGLEGLWEGVEFTEEDIAEARREMWGRWEEPEP